VEELRLCVIYTNGEFSIKLYDDSTGISLRTLTTMAAASSVSSSHKIDRDVSYKEVSENITKCYIQRRENVAE